MAAEMTRVRIIGLKQDLLPAVRALRVTGLVDIDDINEAPDMPIRPFELDPEGRKDREKLAHIQARAEGLADTLGCSAENLPQSSVDFDEHMLAELDFLAARVEMLEAQAEKLDTEESLLPRYAATLKKLLPEMPDFSQAENTRAVGVMINRKNLDLIDLLRSKIIELTDGAAEISSGRIDADSQGMLIVFPEEDVRLIEDLLSEKDIARFKLPGAIDGDRPWEVLESIESRIAAIPEEREALEDNREGLSQEWCRRLARWSGGARSELAIYEILTNLGQTENTFVIIGWTRAADFQDLLAAFETPFDGRVSVEEIEIPDSLKDQVPVILENPAPVRPFESLVHLLASPTYQGLDPTWLMAVFLPLLFGMILGDAGYGAVLLLVSLLLMRRFKEGFAADLARVLAYGSGWSILFGVLYGEAFGTLGEELGLHPILFHRGGEEITSLLIMSLGVGAAHILIGLAIGLWTAVQHRDRREILERGGMLAGLVALLMLSGVIAGVLPRGLLTPSIVGVLVGVAILGSSMGWIGILIGPIEFLSLIGNVLSYLRIAAIGLASVYLAQVANDLAGSLGVLVIGVLIAVLIHALNIALGAFSPSIHALRLHYVEFFRKFYSGGGRRFDPFSLP